MTYTPTPAAYAALALAAGAAGFIDSIAGGGGIITIPALLAAGLPPHLALGTNKLQSAIGTLAATISYRRAGFFTFSDLAPCIAATAVGAGLGAAAVGAVDATALKVLIPVLLAGILVFLALRPRFGLEASRRLVPLLPFWIGAGLSLGFYDGFFGPGTGTFWAMSLVGIAGFGMKEATARTKVANFVSALVSLCVFVSAGSVIPLLGLAMGATQAIGAYAGSRMVVRRGAGFVRVVLIAATAAMVVYIVLRYWVL